LLLNGWVSVSSTTREAARWAATGLRVSQWTDVLGTHDGVFDKVAQSQAPPGVASRDQKVIVEYQTATAHWVCTAPPYVAPYTQCTDVLGGGSLDPSQVPPAPPGPPTPLPSGATVTVTIIADTYEVITPLIRPIFGCDGTVVHCYIPIKSSNAMYFEGVR